MKAKIDFILNGKFYEENKEIELAGIKFEEVIKLNEKGYIYPLTTKELYEIKEKIENSSKKKEVK